MKHREAESELFENGWVFALLKEQLVVQGLGFIAADHVRLEPNRRLVCHLDSILEDGAREVF